MENVGAVHIYCLSKKKKEKENNAAQLSGKIYRIYFQDIKDNLKLYHIYYIFS